MEFLVLFIAANKGPNSPEIFFLWVGCFALLLCFLWGFVIIIFFNFANDFVNLCCRSLFWFTLERGECQCSGTGLQRCALGASPEGRWSVIRAGCHQWGQSPFQALFVSCRPPNKICGAPALLRFRELPRSGTDSGAHVNSLWAFFPCCPLFGFPSLTQSLAQIKQWLLTEGESSWGAQWAPC